MPHLEEERIFVESKVALHESTGAGHLYLVRRLVEVCDDGTIVNVYRPGTDQVIRAGTPFPGVLTPLSIFTGSLSALQCDDRYQIMPDGVTLETPQDRHSIDITSYIQSGGVHTDVATAWNAMRNYALGINATQ